MNILNSWPSAEKFPSQWENSFSSKSFICLGADNSHSYTLDFLHLNSSTTFILQTKIMRAIQDSRYQDILRDSGLMHAQSYANSISGHRTLRNCKTSGKVPWISFQIVRTHRMRQITEWIPLILESITIDEIFSLYHHRNGAISLHKEIFRISSLRKQPVNVFSNPFCAAAGQPEIGTPFYLAHTCK